MYGFTLEEFKKEYHYDPNTGVISKLNDSSNQWKAGALTGYKRKSGHIYYTVFGKSIHGARIVIFYMTGIWPDHADHKDNNPGNNKYKNLRDVSRTVNVQNQTKPQKTNTSGYLGVSYSKKEKKYLAHIRVNGKQKRLGAFSCSKEAHQAYLIAKRQYHEGCTI